MLAEAAKRTKELDARDGAAKAAMEAANQAAAAAKAAAEEAAAAKKTVEEVGWGCGRLGSHCYEVALP